MLKVVQEKHKPLLFETKAKNLQAVSTLIEHAKVPPFFIVNFDEFKNDPAETVQEILLLLGEETKFAVRSSCPAEDGLNESNAGAFLSLLNVTGRDSLKSAITQVFASYPFENVSDEVLVQPMVADVICSGVAFSHDPENNAPYVTINYSESNDTEAVTSGAATGNNVYRWHRSAEKAQKKDFYRLINLVDELEKLFNYNYLDIEFAISCDKTLYLLQVRPATTREVLPFPLDVHTDLLKRVEDQIDNCRHRNPFLLGDHVVFGIMPDWNPAEIIGPRPLPLALSLYRKIITDNIWAYQRNNYGYRNLRSCPLLIDFHGLPYVDVKVSFNSFLPKSLRTDVAEKLVNHYLETLIAKPELHDRVEFDIVISCFSFDIIEKLAALPDDKFSDKDREEIKSSLIDLTVAIVHSDAPLWKNDLQKLDTLTVRREKVLSSNAHYASKIYWLLEDCQRYGTLPFAGLARTAFIAVQLLKSLVNTNILTPEEADLFLSSVNTVTNKMMKDFTVLGSDELSAEYGHLRPGTYDILSPRYDAAFAEYFGEDKDRISTQRQDRQNHKVFRLSLDQINAIELLLKQFNLPLRTVELFNFMTEAIEAREYAKFEFSKNLSAALELFADYGEQYGFSRQDLSHACIETIYEAYRSCEDPYELLKASIDLGKKKYSRGKSVNLPSLIWQSDHVWSHVSPVVRGNYITNEIVVSKVVECSPKNDLEGKIVKILNADPGYDWIFSRNIAGFITAYGGVNSHMAIRARELNLPAAIGIGENHYNAIEDDKVVRMDCAAELIIHV